LLVAGERGQDQPTAWRIVTRDSEQPGRFREFVVQNGKVVDERFLRPDERPPAAQAALATRRVRVDSKQVFVKADAAARKALVGFDSLDYELRTKEFSTDPVWVVRLNDQDGTVVGELAISCDNGAILRSSWFEPDRRTNGPASAVARRDPDGDPQSRVRVESSKPSSPQSSGETAKQTHAVWDRTVEGFHAGREFIHESWRKATGSVREAFTRWRQPGRSNESWDDGVYDSAD
jgi:hypothetical protein